MKIAVDIGHNCPYDGGAVGIGNENDLNKAVGDNFIKYLKQLGHAVTDCLPYGVTSLQDSLYKRITVANRDNVDLYVSIHFNAGGGRGTEVFAISQTGKNYAQKVVNEIASLGFTNRGVKDGSSLYVLKNTNAPAILVECAFVDSAEDMQKVKDIGPDAIARAIVKGITGQEIKSDEYHGLMYRVHVQNIGWQEWKKLGETAGTIGESLRIEALEIKEV
jgi:N-acetylmuramoyl-L-alanine amidase